MKKSSSPKRSVYLSAYRVLERVPLQAIGSLYLTTDDGRVLFAIPWHDRVLQNRRRAERAVQFYERGIARLEDRWRGHGPDGARFFSPLPWCCSPIP